MDSMNDNVIAVQLRRTDSSHPWGFRLEGGLDHHRILRIQRITPNSIAHRANLCPGDVILCMGNINAQELTHEKAKMEIIRSGNDINFLVQRGTLGDQIWKPSVTPASGNQSYNYHKPSNAVSLPQHQQHQQRPQQRQHTVPHQQQQQQQPFQQSARPQSQTTKSNVYELPTHLNQTRREDNSYSSNAFADVPILQHTSLASGKANPKSYSASAYNALPTPFNETGIVAKADDGRIKKISHSQYNSPMGLYSNNNVEHSLQHTYQEAIHRTAADTDYDGHCGAQVTAPQLAGTSTKAVTAATAQVPSMYCGLCGEMIKGVFVRVQGKIPMHPQCLKCTKCGVGLRNIGYFYIDGKLYCEVHARQVTRPAESGMAAVVSYR